MSERVQRYVLWLLAVALVAGTALALRYSRGYRPVAGLTFGGPPPLPGDVALRFDAVRVVGRKNNRRAWELTAGRVDTTRSRTRVDFSGNVKATLLDAAARPRATFSAPQATYDVGAKVLVAAPAACVVRPAIVADAARSPDPSARAALTIDARQAVWNIGANAVTCPGPVTVSLPGLSVRGDDLNVDLRTRDHSLKRVSGTVTLNDDAPAAGPSAAGPLPTALRALEGLFP